MWIILVFPSKGKRERRISINKSGLEETSLGKISINSQQCIFDSVLCEFFFFQRMIQQHVVDSVFRATRGARGLAVGFGNSAGKSPR